MEENSVPGETTNNNHILEENSVPGETTFIKKNYPFVIPVIVIILATLLYLFFISSFNGFDQTNKRFLLSLEKLKEIPTRSTIFLGDSQIREDIDCNIIDSMNVTCFNFGIEGILPIQLAMINKEIISSKPKRVVIGVSQLFFTESINKNDDIFFFIGEKEIIPDKFVWDMLSREERNLISMNSFQRALHKRKFILSFYLNLLKGSYSEPDPARPLPNKAGNFKDPFIYDKDQKKEDLDKKLSDINVLRLFEFNNSGREYQALEYFINELTNQSISVSMIKMPLNPLLRDKLHSESIGAYTDYMLKISSKYNVSYIDLSDKFQTDEFIDLTHLNKNGRGRLSSKIARGN